MNRAGHVFDNFHTACGQKLALFAANTAANQNVYPVFREDLRQIQQTALLQKCRVLGSGRASPQVNHQHRLRKNTAGRHAVADQCNSVSHVLIPGFSQLPYRTPARQALSSCAAANGYMGIVATPRVRRPMDDRKHISDVAHRRAAGVIRIGCAVATRLVCNAVLQHMQRSESFRTRPGASYRVGA